MVSRGLEQDHQALEDMAIGPIAGLEFILMVPATATLPNFVAAQKLLVAIHILQPLCRVAARLSPRPLGEGRGIPWRTWFCCPAFHAWLMLVQTTTWPGFHPPVYGGPIARSRPSAGHGEGEGTSGNFPSRDRALCWLGRRPHHFSGRWCA